MAERNLDFDKIVDRRNTRCLKYDFAVERHMPADVLPLWVADMDFETSSYIEDALIERAKHAIYGYSEAKTPYFEILKKWMQKHHDWDIQRKWLIKTPGVVFALAMAVKAYTEPGDAVLIQQPVYYPFSEVIKDNGRNVVSNTLYLGEDNRYHIDLEDFEQKIVENQIKLFLLCNPHNPVGRVWTKEELARVGEICKKNNVLVIADEIHSDLVYAGYVHTPFALASDAPHLVCTSLGKTFNVAGLRLANIFSSSAELKKQYDQEIDAYSYSASNTFGLEMVQAAYSPEGEAWLEELLVYLQGNVEVVSEWCQKHNVGFTAPQGTFLCWLDLASAGLTDEEIIKKIIMGKEVICVPGPWFGKGGEGHLRLNIGCTRKTLVEALDRIASVLNN